MRKVALTIAVVLLLVSIAEAAIDTADKRASVIPHDGPIPDSDLDAGDRAQVLGEYRGLLDGGSGGSSEGTTAGNGAFWTIRRFGR